MPPRRRPQFTQETIDQQLQQIHLLDQSSSSENLEQLGPIIKQIHANRQQDAYLRAVGQLIQTKDAEIETICGDNYQEFISSVSTLFSVKSYTTNLRDKIQTLDAGVEQIGRGLVEKKRALLQTKKTAGNLDEAVETLQACLRVLDVVNRVGEMVKEGKYWSALRVSRSSMDTISVCSVEYTSFVVTRRHREHADHLALPDAPLPTPIVLPAISSRSNQGCSVCIHEAVAVGHQECQRTSRAIST